MVSDSTKKTVILTVSAIVGITAISSLVYLLIQDDKKVKHQRNVRKLQRSLSSDLSKIDKAVQQLVEGEIRQAQIRAKVLRSYSLYPGDEHVQLPSLGLSHKQDEKQLGLTQEETPEEMAHERSQGFEDHAKARQGYKRLDFMVKGINEQLLKLLETLDAVTPRELTEMGDGFGGLPSANGIETHAFEKVRRRKRELIVEIQKIMVRVDSIGHSIQARLEQVENYEAKGAEEPRQPTKDLDKMKDGVTFAEVAASGIPAPKTLAPTEDLQKMEEGVTYAQVAASKDPSEEEDKKTSEEILEPTSDLEKMKEGVTYADVVADAASEHHSSDKEEILEPTEDLKKMKEGITFAEVAAAHTPEQHEANKEDILEPTADLEKMREGTTFAEVAAAHTPEQHEANKEDILEPTADLEKMKEGTTFAEVAAHNIVPEPSENQHESKEELLEPTEDLEKMKEGITFAQVAAVVPEGEEA
ncbi:hypothetical protein DFQ27_005731 [Actinomortierella ambigua]|uniref:BAG domain-containing protein n=1 Tax=Actinomortierella ambigua TaxID=1343610 RepID=A0A9P6QHK6_9FUNG|nr:hypothetical protein DFQ27_005731 [Actinomortierella ambigua]